MPRKAKSPADYIVPLYINRLEGRMLIAPSKNKKQREILLIYGHHAMLERWWSLVENLREYGNVTMPDMPGLGGMEPFSKIGIKPSVDAFADYLAAFIKLRYKRKPITIYAISFGFVVVTRMLQKYPELTKKVELLISVVGFMHHSDFHWSLARQKFYRVVTRFFATRPIAFFIRYGALNRPVIELLTKTMPNSKHRFIEVKPKDFEKALDFDVKIWRANDVRTHWLTTSEFFVLDNTKNFIKLPVIHVISAYDHYLNNIKVEEHMRRVFTDYKSFMAKSKVHVPYITADKKATGVLLPIGLRRLLSKKSQS